MQSFATTKKFRALEFFPYGLERSGDFLRSQVELLTQYGTAYYELNNGVRQPETPQEQDFVSFCQGHKPAENEHEKAWKRFTDVTSHPRGYIPLTSSQRSSAVDYGSDTTSYDDSDLGFDN
jgi:uncharacterized protein